MELINKRGIFFTALTIIILSLFVLSFTLYSNLYERKSIEKRVSTMNGFLFSTEEDLSRKLYIFGYRAIFLDEESIVNTGSYINNFNSTIQETFFNGTLNNQSQNLMIGVTFNDIQNDINQAADKINVNINLNSPKIEVKQIDPWHITLILTSNLMMEDEAGLASWNKTSIIQANVSITNFEDPLYYVSTQGLVISNITKTPFTTFISGSDISNLSAHVSGSYYKESTSAPDFINRIEGKNTPSQFGVESLVNLQKLSQQGVSVQDKSIVDYIYFSNNNPNPLCMVSGMPSWFKINSAKAASYNITPC